MKQSIVDKRAVRAVIFGLLALMILCFIFSNSAQSGPESHEKSGWVAEFLRPILNPFGWIEETLYLKLVRKLAHFVEFGALGVCLGGVAANITLSRKWLYAAVFCLLTACADETLQAFTGRTNSLKDVCIDFSGAACGIAFVWLLLQIMKRYKGRRTWQN